MESQTEVVVKQGYDALAPRAFLDLRRQFAGIRAEVLAAVTRVLESQHFILGAEVEALEREVAAYVGCSHAIGCASGSDALLLALTAAGVGSSDEVITVPFTFVATAAAIARLGATPVFVDIGRDTYNIDPRGVERAITKRTKAILPVHLFGLPADMEPIRQIAKQAGILVIEDAAQAIGASYKGTSVGRLGEIGCLSFFPSKNLGGAGDGGMCTTDDPQIAQTVRMLRTHGSREKYKYELLGMNSRLDALQAAILRVKLRHLDEWTNMRRRNAASYRTLFEEAGLQPWVTLPAEPSGSRHVYNQFVIRVRQRDQLRDHLRAAQVLTEIYYPQPLHTQRAFANLGCKQGDFPESEAASREVLALPIYPELTIDEQRHVVNAIAEFFRSADSNGGG